MIREPNTEPIPAPDPATPTVAAPVKIIMLSSCLLVINIKVIKIIHIKAFNVSKRLYRLR